MLIFKFLVYFVIKIFFNDLMSTSLFILDHDSLCLNRVIEKFTLLCILVQKKLLKAKICSFRWLTAIYCVTLHLANLLNLFQVLPKKAKWIQDRVVSFHPEENKLTVGSGKEISYDFLVIAMGLQLNYDQVSLLYF